MGDFNAKVGECQPDEEATIGKFGYGQRNKRGEMLLEFAAQHKLVTGNTFFKKNKNRYWAWESPDGHTRNQIDFILSSQRGIIQDCGVITNVDIGSDHRMVRAKLHISKRLARLKFIRNEKKSKINILRLREKRPEFQLELKNRFEGLDIEELDLDQKYQTISSTVMEVAAEVAPQEKRRKQITEEDKEIEALDRRRKELTEITDKSIPEKSEYRELVKTVRKKRRQRSRKKRKEQIEIILKSGRGPQHIAKLNRRKSRMHQMRQTDGVLTNDRQEILNVCADFYKDLYSSKSNEAKPNTISPDISAIPSITQKEVDVKEMKDSKAPGTDDITSDIIKVGGAGITQHLVGLYNQILDEKRIPVCWKEAKVILLYKKGEKTDIKTYRPISLLSHVYKIFTRIIQNRIKGVLDENQPREQAGFRIGYSTVDHLHAINQLIEKANEYNLKLCIGYIDYEKAFDSVEHKDLFTALPMEDIFRKLNLQERGINIDGEKLTDLRFADDVALVTTSVKDMEVQLNDLNKGSKKIGLNIHKGKTKYMTNHQSEDVIVVEGDVIERVERYRYLGQTVKMEDNTREAALIRIKAVWKTKTKKKNKDDSYWQNFVNFIESENNTCNHKGKLYFYDAKSTLNKLFKPKVYFCAATNARLLCYLPKKEYGKPQIDIPLQSSCEISSPVKDGGKEYGIQVQVKKGKVYSFNCTTSLEALIGS
ncbi:uncharacterized protein [Amphiura filiformis]|uniref:uncharacterized protein n=1 Tax=Amphiura filiformis TaxID=82378 RepID=UPI003B21D4AA